MNSKYKEMKEMQSSGCFCWPISQKEEEELCDFKPNVSTHTHTHAQTLREDETYFE